MGHEQTSRHVRLMSVIPLKADIHQLGLHVRKVPITDNRRYQTKLVNAIRSLREISQRIHS
jgi:hypothetical protein